MTTIAYHHKDKEIAVDGRTTMGGLIITDKANKVITRKDGVRFILSGATSDFDGFCAEFSNGVAASRNYDCGAIVINNGVVAVAGVDNESGTFFASPRDESFASGSGRDFALSAMDFGKSAKEAVKYASTRDSGTGGRITVVKV
jgi:ATP-dependent protease HslVU (ClpYQ) peptidase subunit